MAVSARGRVSGTVIVRDLKNLWPLPVITSLIYFLIQLPLGFMASSGQASQEIYGWVSTTVILALFGTAASLYAYFLFHYLDRGEQVAFYHGLPLSRPTLFYSHTVSFLLMTAGTLVITGGFFALLLVPPLRGQLLPGFLIGYAAYSLLFFAVGTLAMMLCGNVIVAFLVGGILPNLPVYLLIGGLMLGFLNLGGYMIPVEPVKTFSNLYMLPVATAHPGTPTLVYSLIGLVLLVLAFVLYLVRPLENHGEMVAFRFLKPLFIIGVGIFTGVRGYSTLIPVFHTTNLLLLLPFGFVGIIGANMLCRKAFTLKGALPYLAGFAAVIALLWGALSTGWFGYETYVPAPEDVEYIGEDENFSAMLLDYAKRTVGRGSPVYSLFGAEEPDLERSLFGDTGDMASVKLTGREDIEKVIAYHKELIETERYSPLTDFSEEKPYDPEDADDTRQEPVFLTYHLRNGRTVRRFYIVPADDAYDRLCEIPAYKEKRYPLIDGDEKELLGVDVSWSYDLTSLSADDPYAKELYEALCRDLREHTVSELEENPGSVRLTVRWYTPKDGETLSLAEKKKAAHDRTFRLSPAYTHTAAVLKEMNENGYAFKTILEEPEAQ